MSYEIITRFTINTKKNTYSITAHPNNVHPIDEYSFSETMSEKNMRDLFENLLFGNWHPTNSITQLNYAMARTKYETVQHFNLKTYLSDYIWNNAIYLNDERVYTPVDDYAFSLFIKYLFEKTSNEKYIVTNGSWIFTQSRTEGSYRYIWKDSSPYYVEKYHFTMDFKKAYTFIARFNNCIENLRPELIAA